jgi:mannose-1-phosphate guanylyltransferase/phosphomannomutase
MLKAKVPIFGCVMEGYWCDVGTIEEYMRANADVLYGRIKLPAPIGTNIGGGVFVGRDVEIAPNAQLFGPIYLGNEVKIKDGVRIYGPAVVRDYSVVDNHTLIERSIMWRNNYIGEGCEVRGAIIVRECSLKPKVMVFEGAVIGDNCVIGEGSVIHADVKLWPRKEIEPGTVVKDSIIWGNQGRRALFGRFGISGVVNVELTPEFAAKLGAAIGATLPKGSYVAINRDEHRSSRMLKRALISGLPGTGVNVWDLGSVPIPVLRHFIRSHPETTAGLHVRLSPFDQRVVDIRMLNAEGLAPNTANERTIERNFFREDFRRAYLDDIGSIIYAHQPIEAYQEAFLTHVDAEVIRSANFRLVVDFSNGSSADTLSSIFNKLGVDVVALNSRTDESKLAMLQGEFRSNQQRVGKIVSALDAPLGVQLDVGGEKIFLLDEHGAIVDDVTAAAVMTELALYANPGAAVAVPITMPDGFEKIAAWHGGRILRIGQQVQNMAQAAKEPGVILVCDGTGNFVVPDFMPAIDGLMATVRLLQYLAVRALRISEIIKYLPPMDVSRGSIFSPWDAKAAVMRALYETYKNHRMESLDGFKVYLSDDSWMHISPHTERPSIEIVAEGPTTQEAAQVVEQARAQIERLVEAQKP